MAVAPGRTDQHENIGNEKGQQVQECPNTLLPNVGSKRRNHGTSRPSSYRGAVLAANRIGGASDSRAGRSLELGHVLADKESVILLDGAAEELENHAEEKDADAGAGKHAGGCDFPLRGEEA